MSVAVEVGGGQRLLRGGRGPVRERVARLPPAALGDAGQQLQLPRRHLEGLVDGREPRLQLGGRDDHRRQFVADRFDVNLRSTSCGMRASASRTDAGIAVRTRLL